MSGGDMYAGPSYDDVQKDVQKAAGQTGQPSGLSTAGCVLLMLLALALLVVIVLILR